MKLTTILAIGVLGVSLTTAGIASSSSVTANTNWSSLTGGSGPGGLPNSSDSITVSNGAVLTVNVTNAVCGAIRLGIKNSGDGTLTFAASGSPMLVVTTLWVGGSNQGGRNGGGILTMVQGATLSAGTISSGSNTATYNTSAGTIILTGASTLPAGAASFDTLVLGGTVTLGTNTTVGGSLKRTTGSLSLNTYSLTYGPSASLEYENATTQTTGPELSNPMTKPLLINSTGTLNLAGSLTVNGTLKLLNGTLNTGANTLTFGSSATITSNGSGRIEGKISLTLTGSETGIKSLFAPSNSYLNITSPGITFITVESFPGLSIPEVSGGTDTTTAVRLRYYRISAVTGSGVVSLRFDYLAAEQGTGYTNSLGTLWKKTVLGDPVNNPWVDQTAESAGSFYVEKSSVSVNSLDGYYAMAQPNSALPVQIASLAGTVNGNNVRLDWNTVSEVNNYGFYVQRRNDGMIEWTELQDAFIPGHGTTIEPQSYTWTNTGVPQGTYEYRLRMVDYDGSVSYSNVVRLEIKGPLSTPDGTAVPGTFSLSQNYPNPFNPTTKIGFMLQVSGPASLKVFNAIGQEVATLVSGDLTAGFHSAEFNGTNLSSGVYYYRLQSSDKVEVKRMVLTK